MAVTKTKKKSSAPVKKKAAAKTTRAKNSAVKTKKGTASSEKAVISKKETSSKVKNTNGKTHLTASDLKFFGKLIREQKEEILENARKLRESLIDVNTGEYVGDNSTFSMHMAEQGTDEMEREKTYMFIQRDEKHLFYLEGALERIAKKTYGLCVSCGKTITKARLEAVPITSHCINCKQSLSS